jgi:transcription termination/antitermination protein NusG
VGTAFEEAWYAVWLRSHYEHLVAQHLSAKGFHTFLPELRTWSRRLGPKHPVRLPMFPGYLFVRDAMAKERYVDIMKVRGIVRVLEAGWSRLTPIPDEDIDAIQRIVRAEVPVFPHAHLRHGDRVRVLAGPLSGLEGFFVQDKPSKGRLVVSVNMLGRSVAVEVDGTGVEACSSEPTRMGQDAIDYCGRHCR